MDDRKQMEELAQIFRTEEKPFHNHDEDEYDTDFMEENRSTTPAEIDSVSKCEYMDGHSHSCRIEEEPNHDHNG